MVFYAGVIEMGTCLSSGMSYYEICLQGRLGNQWKDWFHGLEATTRVRKQKTITRLIGPVADQSVLLSVLTRATDLSMPILSVQCIDSQGGKINIPNSAEYRMLRIWKIFLQEVKRLWVIAE